MHTCTEIIVHCVMDIATLYNENRACLHVSNQVDPTLEKQLEFDREYHSKDKIMVSYISL